MRAAPWLCGLLALTTACSGSGGKPKMDSKQREQAAEYNMQLGVDYFRQGNLQQAKDKLEKSLEQNPRSAQAHTAAGLLYDRLGDDKKADAHFSRAVSLDPKNPDILNNYAVYLCRKGQVEKGEKYAVQAATDPLYKTPEAAYLNAGYCASSAGDTKRAANYFRQALAVRPRFPEALIRLADLEFHAGNYMPARAFLERYMQTVPASAEALWLGVRIEKGLGNINSANDYARRLKNEFPTSGETHELMDSEHSG